MNCKKCQAKLPSFSSYCENCGTKCPSFAKWLKYYGASLLALLKKRIWLTAIIAGVLVITIGLSIFLSLSNNIDPSDYIIAEVNGFSENGSVAVHIDYESLAEKVLGKKPEPDTAKKYEKYVEYMAEFERLKSTLEVKTDKTQGLKNGDFFIATVTVVDTTFFEEHGFELKEESYTKPLQIGKDTAALDEPAEVDLFKYVEVSFAGDNNRGWLNISNKNKTDTIIFASGNEMEITAKCEYTWGEYHLLIHFPEYEISVSLDFEVSESNALQNGDAIVITFDEDKFQLLSKYGITVKEYAHTYIVEGLAE